jgi:hypothetical protein
VTFCYYTGWELTQTSVGAIHELPLPMDRHTFTESYLHSATSDYLDKILSIAPLSNDRFILIVIMTDTDRSNRTDIFDELNEYCCSDGSSPDGAFDCIFMLTEYEWTLLEQAWKENSPEWRENCAYILGHGSIAECMPMLLQDALFDENINVARQAASSIIGMLIARNDDYDEEYDSPIYLDDEMVVKIRYLIGLMEYAKEDMEILKNLHQIGDGKWEFIPQESELTSD